MRTRAAIAARAETATQSYGVGIGPQCCDLGVVLTDRKRLRHDEPELSAHDRGFRYTQLEATAWTRIASKVRPSRRRAKSRRLPERPWAIRSCKGKARPRKSVERSAMRWVA